MIHEQLIMAAVSDVAGQTRGKGFAARSRGDRLRSGVGWAPTNVQITCFGTIAPSPFGALGDVLLMPDKATETKVDFQDDAPAEHFMLCDIVHLDGRPWECCLRGLLKRALDQLRSEGLTVQAAFEHEFFYHGAPAERPNGYRLNACRSADRLAGVLNAALRAAGMTPDTFMAEYGPAQYEITVEHAAALRAADECVILRQLAHASAARLGQSLSFAPLVTREVVGNGVHIHMSLQDEQGNPALYDADGAHGLSTLGEQFVAGVLRYAPSLIALTAPSVVSYQRLRPHRWSAAYNNLGRQDREACVRLCPVSELNGRDPATQFNIEFRAADAAASPYLQLAALIHAGLQGIRDRLPAVAVTEQDLSELSTDELAARGIEALPQSLSEALDRLAADDTVNGWFNDVFNDVYQRHKRHEIELVAGLDDDELCARYAQVY